MDDHEGILELPVILRTLYNENHVLKPRSDCFYRATLSFFVASLLNGQRVDGAGWRGEGVKGGGGEEGGFNPKRKELLLNGMTSSSREFEANKKSQKLFSLVLWENMEVC